MEDTRQCCTPFPCPYIGGDKTCEECNCYRDDYWDEDEKQAESEDKDGIKRVTNPYVWAGSKFCPNCGCKMIPEGEEK